MKKIILLTLLLPCLFLNGYSVSLDSYLSYVEQRFDESQLVVEDFKTSTISNALALAIASTDMEKSQKFLQVIDDVNDDKLASSAGYRKLVGLPHIAVNPIVQMKIFDNKAKLDFAYAKRMLEIIDLLAQRGTNFNMLGYVNYNEHSYIYNNTPLVYAESISSHYSSDLKPQYELMARAILYGADPKLYDKVYKSSRCLTEYYKGGLKNLKPLILEYYVQLSINRIKFKKVKLAESVLANKEISDIYKAIEKVSPYFLKSAKLGK